GPMSGVSPGRCPARSTSTGCPPWGSSTSRSCSPTRPSRACTAPSSAPPNRRPENSPGRVTVSQRLELLEQPGGPLAELDLGEQDADRAVGVDEELGAGATAPAEAPAPRPGELHRDPEPPAHTVPEAGT